VKQFLSRQMGTKSGENRRKDAAEFWQPKVLDLAKQFRDDDPGISQGDLAAKIRGNWKMSISAPKHSYLVKHLSKLENSGL
jgi:hypothetical protein